MICLFKKIIFAIAISLVFIFTPTKSSASVENDYLIKLEIKKEKNYAI